ncbi:MAG: formate dehydrogenase subunit delta [Proteobacteria bacterium]|nr:formate dehydrogenase subunit delta [Pseudomonadota bacterium]
MQPNQLLRMGNQIATFFDSFPDRQEAMRELAMHLKKFWPPAMRHELLALFDSTGGDAAHALLAAAVRAHRPLIE